MFTVTVEATTEQDALDMAERRARDAGWRVLTYDEVIPVDGPRAQLRRYFVRLRVVAR